MGIRDRLVERLGYQIDQAYVPDTENRAIQIPARSQSIINEDKALQLIPVSRCISVLETAVAQIPVEVFRGIDKLETPAWLELPDVSNNVNQSEFLGQTVVSMALYGNAFWYVTRGARGINNLELIPAGDVNIEKQDDGTYEYYVNGIKTPGERITHLRLWQIPGDILGYGPLQRHKSIIQASLDLQSYADNWFRTSAIPTGTLTTTEFLSPEVALANKQAFVESQVNRSVAVLSSGLSYQSISLNPEEAQFLENQKFVTRQIATMFGVPSMYLSLSVEGSGLTYTNGNEDRKKLYEDGLQQYIIRIQEAITDLLPRGQKAAFNMTEFLKPNVSMRYQAYQVALNAGFMTVDEVRELEGLPQIEMPEPVAVQEPQEPQEPQEVVEEPAE
jgi:HK97 family phage portal protein